MNLELLWCPYPFWEFSDTIVVSEEQEAVRKLKIKNMKKGFSK